MPAPVALAAKIPALSQGAGVAGAAPTDAVTALADVFAALLGGLTLTPMGGPIPDAGSGAAATAAGPAAPAAGPAMPMAIAGPAVRIATDLPRTDTPALPKAVPAAAPAAPVAPAPDRAAITSAREIPELAAIITAAKPELRPLDPPAGLRRALGGLPALDGDAATSDEPAEAEAAIAGTAAPTTAPATATAPSTTSSSTGEHADGDDAEQDGRHPADTDDPLAPTAAAKPSTTGPAKPAAGAAKPAFTRILEHATATQAPNYTTATAKAAEEASAADDASATPTPSPFALGSQLAGAVSPLRHRADGAYRISLRLAPEHLGRVQVEVSLHKGSVDLKVHADSNDTGDLLREHLDDLRRELRNAGLTAGSLDVSTGNPGSWTDAQAHAHQQAQEQPRWTPPASADPLAWAVNPSTLPAATAAATAAVADGRLNVTL